MPASFGASLILLHGVVVHSSIEHWARGATRTPFQSPCSACNALITLVVEREIETLANPQWSRFGDERRHDCL